MPYISQVRREELTDIIKHPHTSGELNYVLTRTIMQYLHDQGEAYVTMNDILGALEGAKLEFYRRVVSKYEDQKIEENGDVY